MSSQKDADHGRDDARDNARTTRPVGAADRRERIRADVVMRLSSSSFGLFRTGSARSSGHRVFVRGSGQASVVKPGGPRVPVTLSTHGNRRHRGYVSSSRRVVVSRTARYAKIVHAALLLPLPGPQARVPGSGCASAHTGAAILEPLSRRQRGSAPPRMPGRRIPTGNIVLAATENPYTHP